MFTGIVEETGRIEKIEPAPNSIRLSISSAVCASDLKLGDSLAVNGCCLTVVKISPRAKATLVHFDLLQETWKLTNLQFARPGDKVNLERSLRADGRLGGHFVTGHIDGVGKIARWERAGKDFVLDVAAPKNILDYIVLKGSVAVDGISLTVAGVTSKGFRLWIIPHTYEATALSERKKQDFVNLETDLLGKYARKFLTPTSS
jgi:riboflavin synthase